MSRTRRAHRTTGGLAALALGASLAVGTPATPAGAAPFPSKDTIVMVPYDSTTTGFVTDGTTVTAEYIPVTDGIVEGDFSAVPGSDVLVFGQGADPDGIIHVTPTETGVTTSFRAETINRYYITAVGDFDGNGIDDIFWYGSGSTPDSIWFFQPDGSHETIHYAVSGLYRPVALDANGDGRDDILWYGRGPAADSLWLFGQDGAYTKRSVTVNGYYNPLVGQFRAVPEGSPRDQIHWHDGAGPDSLWTFDTSANRTSRPVVDVDGSGTHPLVGRFHAGYGDMIFWYRPGSGAELLTGFDSDDNAPLVTQTPPVNGLYTPVVGDFGGIDTDDIAFTRGGRLDIWELGNGGSVKTQTWINTPFDEHVPTVAHDTPGLAD